MTLLAPAVVEPAPYLLDLSAACGWLTSNQRGGWRAGAKTVKEWRLMAGYLARGLRVPAMPRAYVIAEVRFVNRLRRDPANWAPTAKAAIDGLVDVGVLADDDARHLIGPDMRLGPVSVRGPRLRLHVWPLDAAPAPEPTRRRSPTKLRTPKGMIKP